MRIRERQFIPGLGHLLLATFLLGLIGAIIDDFRGVNFGVVGGLIWGGAVLITFLLGTAYISRRLLPIQGGLGWSEGFHLLWRNYTAGAADLLYGRRRVVSAPSRKKKSAIPEVPPSFTLIGAGFLPSYQVAAIKSGGGFKRAAGPGLVILQRTESLAQIFDLRPQSRKESVSATTRDGIPIETSVSVTFQVRQPDPNQRRPRSVEADVLPYPYDHDALFDLLYTGSVTDDDKRDWTDQVCPQAAALLISEIGKVTLDELLVSGGAEALAGIRDNVKQALLEQQRGDQFQTLPQGIEILGVGIGPPQLPDDVIQKRVSSWQVDWRNKIDQEMTAGAIEAQQMYQKARAQAQVENIEKLLLSIEAMRRQSGVELHEVFVRQLLEVLESSASAVAAMPLASRAVIFNIAGDAAQELRKALQSDNDS